MKFYLNKPLEEGEMYSKEYVFIRRGTVKGGTYLIITLPIPIKREVNLSQGPNCLDPVNTWSYEIGWFHYAWCQKDQTINGQQSQVGFWRWLSWRTKLYN